MNQPDHSNRREFIRGRSTMRALQDLAETVIGDTPATSTQHPGQATSRAEACLAEISRRAMACEFQILWDMDRYGPATDTALEALDLVAQLESQLSVYQPDSEVSQLNQHAGQRPIPVEPGLFQLLEQCKTLHEQTAGCFDITSSPLSRLWGFHRRQGELPEPTHIDETRQQVGTQWLELDPEQQTVHFTNTGLEINLGSIGKGYALDRCGELFQDADIQDYIIHGGMSSILAAGSRYPARGDEPGWWIALRHPLKPEKRLAEIRLQDGALGTSGSANQFFYHQGKRFGHVLDPRSGHPADGVLSATVLAPTAALADALATAFFVMGPAEAFQYCDAHPPLAALFVLPGPRQGSHEIQTWGLPADSWKPSELND